MEVGGGVLRIQAKYFRITLGGVFILVQVVLKLSFRRVNFQAFLAFSERAVYFIQRFFEVPFQMQ